MNSYPENNSVIIMDNTRIHYDTNLISLLEGLGYHIVFFSPYSSNYNPIETAFSIIKSWIKCNYDFIEACDDSIYALLVTYSQIMFQIAQSFFRSSIYL